MPKQSAKQRRRPFVRPPPPNPAHRTPPERQPRVRQEADGTWAVVQGETVVKDGFPSMAAAWAFIDRNEIRIPGETNAAAVRYGRYRLP
jgi:hypothetical protein